MSVLRSWGGTLVVVILVEDTRHACNTNSVCLDTAGVTKEEYIRGKPTAVKSTKE